MEKTNPLQIRFLGPYSVGKTSIMKQFIFSDYKKMFYDERMIGVQPYTKSITLNDETITLFIIDSTIFGLNNKIPVNKVVKNDFFTAQGIFLVFDLSNNESLPVLQMLTKEIWKILLSDSKVKTFNPHIMIIGNKRDLQDSETRLFTKKEISDSINQIKHVTNLKNEIEYIEVSAKTGDNIFSMFEKMAMGIISNEKKR